MKHILIIIVIATCLISCNHHSKYWDTLVNIESIIEERPDSALAILEQIDKTELSTDEEKACYALFLSMALDKNYIDLTNDSIIVIAEDYYRDTDNNHEKMLSYYYHARIFYNAKNYSKSLCLMIKSYDCADDSNDFYWKGRIAEQISNIYDANYHGEEAINYAKIGYENLKKAGRQPYVNYSLLSLARTYNNNRKYTQSHLLAKQLLDSAYFYKDSLLLIQIKDLLTSTYLGIDDYNNAINTILEIQKMNGLSSNTRFLLGYSYLKLGDLDAAEKLHKNLEQSYDINDISLSYEISKRKGDNRQALLALSRLYDNLDSIFINSINQNFSQSVNEFRESELRLKEIEISREKYKRNVIICASLLLLLTITTYLINYNRKSKYKLEKNILYAQNLQEILQLRESEFADAQHSIRELLSSRYQVIDNLCRTYYENKAIGLVKKKISNEIEKLIEDFSSNKQKISELEKFVNKNYTNIIISFKADFPNLKEADYLLFLYTSLGFSISAIALFLKEDKLDAVYNRKARLKTKIRKLNPEQADNYLKILG